MSAILLPSQDWLFVWCLLGNITGLAVCMVFAWQHHRIGCLYGVCLATSQDWLFVWCLLGKITGLAASMVFAWQHHRIGCLYGVCWQLGLLGCPCKGRALFNSCHTRPSQPKQLHSVPGSSLMRNNSGGDVLAEKAF